jgi:hypothetical protein
MNFGSDAIGGLIGVKLEKTIPITIGPNHYSPERADSITKPSIRASEFGHHGRKNAVIDPLNGPGTYDENRIFGSDTRDIKIGEKRDKKSVVTLGPG